MGNLGGLEARKFYPFLNGVARLLSFSVWQLFDIFAFINVGDISLHRTQMGACWAKQSQIVTWVLGGLYPQFGGALQHFHWVGPHKIKAQ